MSPERPDQLVLFDKLTPIARSLWTQASNATFTPEKSQSDFEALRKIFLALNDFARENNSIPSLVRLLEITDAQNSLTIENKGHDEQTQAIQVLNAAWIDNDQWSLRMEISHEQNRLTEILVAYHGQSYRFSEAVPSEMIL